MEGCRLFERVILTLTKCYITAYGTKWEQIRFLGASIDEPMTFDKFRLYNLCIVENNLIPETNSFKKKKRSCYEKIVGTKV